ncbi:Translation initiation factor eIF-2B subunit alpha [Ananas comosus]|uniref:Translation initiation factor eIF2B subunit alpha n=1 Tax=Ananas comosus TaxID=4615 RepID=A0A199VHD1_ANACO|nr:Translation initiation factor eIF-2B subunit alpha [Ananas comosus]
MWRRSASFVVDKRYYQHDELPLAMDPQNPNPNPNPNPNANPLSAYYLTRAEHHAVVTSDWLAQAQAAVGRHPSPPPPPETIAGGGGGKERGFGVIDEFNYWRKKPDLAEAVAAIMALAAVIRSSEATTMMELEIELKKASDTLKSWDTTSISLSAGCDLFMRYVTRTSALEYEDFDAAKRRLIERGEKFGEISLKVRRTIAMLCQDFIFDGCTILVHGFSRVVLEVLKLAASNRKLFRFARMYPLDQKDLAPALRPIEFGVPIPPGVEVEKSARDYTPPQYLTLLFTDLGALTPSVVSDELIQLYL